MALRIYPDTVSDPFSVSGDMSNAIRHAFDGSVGGVFEQLYYIHRTTANSYTGITLTPIDFTGASIIDGTDGFSVKMRIGSTQPNSIEWEVIEAGDGIIVSDITDNNYYPFWVRIEVPRGADVETFEDVVFRIEATET